MLGRTLGHYTVVDKLGEGGMGVVYRAHDSVLDRDVALKVLSPAVARDAERMARFEREAKSLAALNHAHVGAIFGLEEVDGQRFLVLELVEGETLAERLDRGPLPISEAIPLAVQIARALEAAHERGIVHRDLKPSNIKITAAGEAKVLDFGLAKSLATGSAGDLSESPTVTYDASGAGVLLGTAAYMSPEQARGQPVDHRTDVWAFGAVLWEMLTGRALIEGETLTDVLSRVVTAEPAWDGLPADLPAGVRRVLRRCLVRDAGSRLHHIADARIELEAVLDGREEEAAVAPERGRWRLVVWLAVPAALAAGWLARPPPKPESLPTVRFEVPMPEGEQLTHSYRHGVALSPDGTLLAFTAGTTSDVGLPDRVQLMLRRLDQREARPIPGTTRSTQPLFSPDGRWIAFITVEPNRLRKVPVAGGEPETICECDASAGATWGPDGTIVFASYQGDLYRVSATGGTPEPLIGEGDEPHGRNGRLPHFLPGGETILLTAEDARGQQGVYVLSLFTGETKRLLENASDARFVASGHLLFARSGQLFAVRFDPRRLEVSGPEVVVVDALLHAHLGPNRFIDTSAAQFALSDSGTLAYAEGSIYPEPRYTVHLVTRQGEAETVPVEPRHYAFVRFSPDGRRILLAAGHASSDAYLYDLDRETLTRQTFDGDLTWLIWGPGPDRFTFASDREGISAIYSKQLDSGPGAVERLLDDSQVPGASPAAWSPDGSTLLLHVQAKGGLQRDLWAYTPGGTAEPFIASEYDEWAPAFSPDGRWLAYSLTEFGVGTQVYVRRFPELGPAVQVSSGVGTRPVWSHDGTEIVYKGRKITAVSIRDRGETLEVGRPQDLFEDPWVGSHPLRSYDLARDGRFVFIALPDEAAVAEAVDQLFPRRIQVVQNWIAELERKLPPEPRPAG